jgi:hypothetical protein
MYLGESIGLSCVSIFIHGFFSSGLSGSAVKYFLNMILASLSSFMSVCIISSVHFSPQFSQSVSSH